MKLPSKSYENTALLAALLHAAYPAKQALFWRSLASARPAPVVRVSRSTLFRGRLKTRKKYRRFYRQDSAQQLGLLVLRHSAQLEHGGKLLKGNPQWDSELNR